MIRVLIKASSAVARAGLAALLREHPSFHVIDPASESGSATSTNPDSLPDILLAEIEGQDDEVARDMLAWATDGAAVVLLVHHHAAEWTAEALRAGVKAVLPSSLTAAQIVTSLEAVAAGLLVFHPSDTDLLHGSKGHLSEEIVASITEPLTGREIEVLRLLAMGLANKEIAVRLEISEHTVKFHVASIMGKLGASSRTEAVTLGIRQGMVII